MRIKPYMYCYVSIVTSISVVYKHVFPGAYKIPILTENPKLFEALLHVFISLFQNCFVPHVDIVQNFCGNDS